MTKNPKGPSQLVDPPVSSELTRVVCKALSFKLMDSNTHTFRELASFPKEVPRRFPHPLRS
jgi:hypothetical protein